jgi:hypothetical protein
LTEQWVGPIPEVESSIDRVVLRYLAAFGPATVSDVRQWCGVTKLKEVVERLRPNLVSFRDAGGRELFDLPDAPRPDPGTPAPPRFFPEYDNVFISHADRSRMAPEEFRGKMGAVWLATENRNLATGPQPPENLLLSWSMFSVDGFLSGTWKVKPRDGRPTLLLQPMVRISGQEADELAAEGRRLLAFLTGTALPENLEVEFVSARG